MPLDPQVKVYLDGVAAMGLPAYWQVPPEEARRLMMVQATPEIVGHPEQVGTLEDRTIPGPRGPIPLRAYRPRDAASSGEALPALVYFHGGGWVIGNLATHDVLCRSLANRSGCVVVSVDYRLAPEDKFPAAPDDCFAAARYIAEHAGEFGVDPSRMAVGGDSAGGNLATVVALMARERGGPSLRFQVMIYPVTDFSFDTPSYRDCAEGYGLTMKTMMWFWDHYLGASGDGRHPYASPLRAPDLRGLPPALVITAEYDVLRDEGEAYAARLRDAGVPVRLRRYDGMIHGFMRLTGALDRGRRAIDEAAGALRTTLA